MKIAPPRTLGEVLTVLFIVAFVGIYVVLFAETSL